MSIQPPQGILNIPNATLRVGKLIVDSTAGLDTFINTIQRNTIILKDLTVYNATKQWDIKLPNVWVAAFNIKGIFSFNFHNTISGTAASGYTLAFSGTTLTLKYNDTTLATSTTIPNLDTTYGEVYVTFEKQYITVTVNGTIYLSYNDNIVRPAIEGEFINFFNTSGLRLKNIKIVAGNWISDGTSNIFLVGGDLTVNENVHISSNLTVSGNVSSNLTVTGNVETQGKFIGDGSALTGISSNLQVITDFGNVTSNTVQFTNAITGLVTTANVEIGGELTVTGNVAVDTDTLFVNSVNNRVGVGTTTPSAELHVAGTGAIIVPAGTTGERPDTAANGMIRYNSTTGFMEAYSAVGWQSISWG